MQFNVDVQESVKTKCPQLHYESKLYMLLQGGSECISGPLFLLHRLKQFYSSDLSWSYISPVLKLANCIY